MILYDSTWCHLIEYKKWPFIHIRIIMRNILWYPFFFEYSSTMQCNGITWYATDNIITWCNELIYRAHAFLNKYTGRFPWYQRFQTESQNPWFLEVCQNTDIKSYQKGKILLSEEMRNKHPKFEWLLQICWYHSYWLDKEDEDKWRESEWVIEGERQRQREIELEMEREIER